MPDRWTITIERVGRLSPRWRWKVEHPGEYEHDHPFRVLVPHGQGSGYAHTRGSARRQALRAIRRQEARWTWEAARETLTYAELASETDWPPRPAGYGARGHS